MSNITYYEKIIQEKVKQSSFRDFLKQVASWYTVGFYKGKESISVYPETDRAPHIVSPKVFGESLDTLTGLGFSYDTSSSFFENYAKLFHRVPFSALRQFPVIENSEYTDSSGW